MNNLFPVVDTFSKLYLPLYRNSSLFISFCSMGFNFLKVTFPVTLSMVFRTKNSIPRLEDPLSLGVLISTDVEIPGAYIKVSMLNYIPPKESLSLLVHHNDSNL